MGIAGRWGLPLMALGALCVSGCPSGADVLLGHAPLVEDGGAGDTGAADDIPARTCSGDIAGRPVVALRIDARADGCTEPCNPWLNVMQVAEDGSVWAAGRIVRPSEPDIIRSAIWHFDAAGNELGFATLEGTPRALALDDTGQAWLLVYLYDARSSIDLQGSPPHLHRFDASAHELQMQVLAGDYAEVRPYPGHGVLLLGSSVTALDYDGQELWASDGPTGNSLAVADDGGIVVGRWTALTTAPDFSRGLVLDWLNNEGEVVLSTSTSLRFASPELNLLLGPDGELAVAAPLYDDGARERGFVPPVQVTRLDSTGATKWRWIADASVVRSAVDPATGTILVAGPGATVVALSPDGTSCRRFEFDGPDLIDQISVGSDGEVWFLGTDFPSHTTSWIGRLERPDLRW